MYKYIIYKYINPLFYIDRRPPTTASRMALKLLRNYDKSEPPPLGNITIPGHVITTPRSCDHVHTTSLCLLCFCLPLCFINVYC